MTPGWGNVVVVAGEAGAQAAIDALGPEHVVRTVPTAEAARLLVDSAVDVLIVDLDDIGPGAFALLRQLSSSPIIVLVSAAEPSLSDVKALEKAGISVQLVRKPVPSLRLVVLVRTFVRLSQLRRATRDAASSMARSPDRVVVLEPYGEMCLAFLRVGGGAEAHLDIEVVWAATPEIFIEEMSVAECHLAVIDADEDYDLEELCRGARATEDNEEVPIILIALRDVLMPAESGLVFARKPVSLERLIAMRSEWPR